MHCQLERCACVHLALKRCVWARVRRMGCDDYIIASIELYLDVMNVFQFMMLLLSGGDL